MKKHLKWIIPLCAAVLVAVGVLAAILLLKPADTDAGQVLVGWNVDKDTYWNPTLNTTTRVKAGQYYRVRFAINGEQVDLFVDNYEMVNTIDSQKFVGLEVDENNMVTRVLKPHLVGGGLAVYQYYVIDVSDGVLLCNNLGSGKGLPLKLKINENTQVYDVGGEGLLVGLPTELQVGCQVYGVFGEDGYVSHIFSMPPFEPKPVYWNVNRMYDTASKTSTRTRDELGYFVYDMVVDGEPVTLRTRDLEVANKVDAFAAKCMRLEFDEEGLIRDAVHAKFSTGGSSIASWHNVLRIDSLDGAADINVVSNGFYAEKFSGSDKGHTVECTLADNVKIYDMTGKGPYVGAPTTLQLYDQVHGLTNPFGDVCILFVVARSIETDLYYNIDRQWDNSRKVSTRYCGADGYYRFDMSVAGKRVSLKTDDPEIVNIIDGRAAKVLGLVVDGDRITDAYIPSQVMGSSRTVFDYCEVTDIADDGMVTAKRNGNQYYGKITDETKIYNVSSAAAQPGEPTTVRLGDKLYGLADFEGNIKTVYVVNRQMPGPVYWNLDRNYNTAGKVTRRTAAEDGFYYFKLFNGRKTVTYKTDSKALANKLDSFVAVALRTKGDLILDCYKYDVVAGYTGGGFASWSKVTAIKGNTITAVDNKGTSYMGTMAPNCSIFNVSQGSEVQVKPNFLQHGDRIHGIKNADGQIVVIYIVERTINCDLYYNLERKWDDATKQTTRVPDDQGYYVLTLLKNGQQVTLKTKEADLVNLIDSRAAQVAGIACKDGIITGAYRPNDVKGSEKTVFDYAVVTAIAADGTITAQRGGKTFTAKPNVNCKVFNVSAYAKPFGQADKVQVGDTLYGLGPGADQLNHIYIAVRQVDAELYYNVQRLWADGASTRVPDSDGWYHFTMSIAGRQVSLKTKDTKIVNLIDSRAAKTVALKVADGVILEAYMPNVLQNCSSTVFDYAVVTQIGSDGTMTAQRGGKTFTGKLTADCGIYDVTAGAKAVGEKTTVQVGDTVYGLGKGSTVHSLFVTARHVPSVTGYCQACGQEVTWKLWDGSTLSAGHWYLQEDVTVTKANSLAKERTMCLDLHGREITGAADVERIFNIYGNFNLMDSVGGGKVTATYANAAGKTGSVFYVQSSKTNGVGNMQLYGGTLTATGTTKSGGIGGIAGKFTMFGGALVGGGAADGTGLYIQNAADIPVRLLGGSISGSRTFVKGPITLGGQVQIADLMLSGAVARLEQLTGSASITFTLAATYGTVAENAVEADKAFIHEASGKELTLLDGKLVVNMPVVGHQDHCVCAGLGEVGDHTCATENPVWEPWTGSWESGKYYYLTADYAVTETIKIDEGAHLHLCLNGYDMIGDAKVNRIFNIFGVLELCDHKCTDGTYAGEVINNYDIANGDIKTGGVFYVQNRADAKLNLYGGVLRYTTKLKNGGVGGVTAKLNLYAGVLQGSTVSGDGGVLYLEHNNALVTLYGGKITGGSATNGGNIYMKNGKVVIDGATVSGGYASNAGGSIRVQAGTTLQIISGSVSAGHAKGNGGNIYSLGNIQITGGQITGGSVASGKIGGNLYASGGTLSVSNARITGGSATTGGNLAIKVSATIADSVITGGTADTGSNVYFEKDAGDLTLTGKVETTVYVKSGSLVTSGLSADADVTQE